jgi:aspartate/methionine/tyrosine aminotransferase
MIEVCSTTLPQKSLPRILQHPAYSQYLDIRRRRYDRFAQIAYDRLKDVPGVLINRTNGAFYMSVAFEEGCLNHRQSLPISDRSVGDMVADLTSDPHIQPDKRFVYYLLAATGICVVPLTSFSTPLQGFRLTLLEPNEDRFKKMIETLRQGIEDYLGS